MAPTPVTIPEPTTGQHDRAPFIHYDLDAESPQIYVTRGHNCREYRFPLKAKPVLYPRPRLTTRQQHLFDSGEEFTTMVDRALQQEGDLSLTAKVQRYRNTLYDIQLSARRMVQARQALDNAQWALRDSANRLTAANAYQTSRTPYLLGPGPGSIPRGRTSPQHPPRLLLPHPDCPSHGE
jgi:hypothetical protein